MVLEELGRTLTPSPFLGSAVLAAQTVLLSVMPTRRHVCSRHRGGEVVAVVLASARLQRPA